MVMLQYINRSGARRVGNQAGTAPNSMGPPPATGSNQDNRNRQCISSSQHHNKALSTPGLIVFAQWNAEG